MELDKASNLINLIAEKERKERQKRQRMILGGIGAAVLIGVGVGAIALLGGPGSPTPPERLFEADQLTRSQVISLFEQSQDPILVRQADGVRIDTIYSPEEYTLYLAARPVAIRPSMPENEATGRPDPAIDPSNVTGPLATADIMPAFPGGEAALYRFLSNQIRYPEEALRNKIEGKVYIRFVVQADGSITDVDVLRGIGYGCDQEALRVVQMMPRWVPGELGGTKVPVYSSLAIEFKFL